MSDDNIRVEGAPEPSPPVRRSLLLPLLAALAAAILFGISRTPAGVPGTAIDDVDPPPPVEQPLPADRMLAVADTGRALVLELGDLPAAIDVPTRGPVGEMEADADGVRVAALAPVLGAETVPRTLSVGTAAGLETVETSATSFSWHPTEPGRLAWTIATDEGTELVAGIPGLGERVASLPSGAVLTAWGDWGYALHLGDRLVTLDEAGHVVASDTLRLLAASPDGRLVVAESNGHLIERQWSITGRRLTGGIVISGFHRPEQHPVGAVWLPRSDRLVVWSNLFVPGDESGGRVDVLDRTGRVVGEYAFRATTEQVAWSSDETVLIVSGFRDTSPEAMPALTLLSLGEEAPPVTVAVDRPLDPVVALS